MADQTQSHLESLRAEVLRRDVVTSQYVVELLREVTSQIRTDEPNDEQATLLRDGMEIFVGLLGGALTGAGGRETLDS